MRLIGSRILRRALIVCTAMGAVILTGCGGGGGGGSSTAAPAAAEAPTAGIPQSAYMNIDAFIGYLRNMAPSETAEPLSTGKGTPPVSETALPTQIN
ncbi:MAG: hypothetical protein ABSF50_14120 [Burkholderiaceae bacterium]|jgi:hypothetical protein